MNGMRHSEGAAEVSFVFCLERYIIYDSKQDIANENTFDSKQISFVVAEIDFLCKSTFCVMKAMFYTPHGLMDELPTANGAAVVKTGCQTMEK